MEETCSLIPHVFFPVKLPGTATKIIQEETCLLKTFQKFLSGQDMDELDISRTVLHAFQIWKNVQDTTDDVFLAKTIGNLKPGEFLPLYVRSQNAGIILSVPKTHCDNYPNSVVLTTFPASQKSADVIAAPGDLMCTFPEKSVHIPQSQLLSSATLARQLIALNCTLIEDAMSKTKVSDTLRGNDRDVPDPKYVAKWICASLCSTDSCLCKNFPRIVKKVRDEVVIAADEGIPFRRSGLWMSIKVTLQLILVSKLGPTAGKHAYKILMLKFLCIFCSLESLRADEGVQILAKIGRRYLKLTQIRMFSYEKSLTGLIRVVEASVGDLRLRLNEQWADKKDKEYKLATLQLEGKFDFVKDTHHELKSARQQLQARNVVRKLSNQNEHIPVPVGPRRDRSTHGFTQLSYFMDASGEEDLGVALYDFERNVLTWEGFVNLHYCEDIRTVFSSYLHKAAGYYSGDPVGISRMMLICLKMVQVLDKTVCGHYPKLLQHGPSVPVEIVQHLMLPERAGMNLAFELEIYFKKRESTVRYPGLLDEHIPSYDSYSVRHSLDDWTMRDELQRILHEGEDKAREKRREVEQQKAIWDSLIKRARRMPCTCILRRSLCEKCRLVKQAEDMRVEVHMYPLPPCTIARNAIVFELMIPTPIACLRDVLSTFLTHLQTLQTSCDMKTMWPEHEQLTCHSKHGSWDVNIGSTDMPISKTHFKTLHPKEPTANFVVENNCDTILCVKNNLLCLLSRVPQNVFLTFVFQVERDSPYAGLQWTLNDHQYWQNTILARQQECPQNLKLMEFIEFGTMRADHSIQLRNLYRVLKQGTLSLREDSVFSLICQVLWRAGSNSNPPTVIREFHEDLLCEEFVEEFLSLLSVLIESFSKNWNDHVNLSTVIVILLRIFSVSEVAGIWKNCFRLLDKCRKIVFEWCNEIEKLLGSLVDKSVGEQNKIRRKLLEVASCCALTYWSDIGTEKKFLLNDLKTWLLSIKTLRDNIIMTSENVAALPLALRNQLRRVRECGIANENFLHDVLNSVPSEIDGFMRDAWSGAAKIRKGTTVTWTSCSEYQQVYEARALVNRSSTVLHVDILLGLFHVNGKPVGFLPENLMLHEDYKRIFGSYIFEVQSLKQSPWSVISKYDYRESKIVFAMKGNLFVITEVCPNAMEFEYVPCAVFQNQLPHDLIVNYAHWWNKQERVIVFRALKALDNLEVYRLDLKTGLVSETVTGKLVINIKSTSYKVLLKVFRRMEHDHFIGVFLPKQEESSKGNTLDVAFPRMRLNFTVKLTSSKLSISSLEYPEMQVAGFQQCGTLIGLQNGLILESRQDSPARKVLLVPHGPLTTTENGIVIDTTEPRNPRYFAYEIDPRLRQLKAGQTTSASTYLAYLHALTSQPLPDPFTGHTGTERALQLLQSGHCWSCEPFDKETARSLQLISKLSPNRKCYSVARKMTQVEWPMKNSMCCSDAFQIVVKKLVDDSKRLAVLFPKLCKTEVCSNGEHDLCVKAYWRHFKSTTDQCHVASEFLVLEHPSVSPTSKFDYDFLVENVNCVLKMSCLCDRWTNSQYTVKNLHRSLTSGRAELVGITDKGFPLKETIVQWLLLDFWNSWLDLYQLAQKASSGLRPEWALILCSFAFMGLPEQHLILLQTIAVHHARFAAINPPPYSAYSFPSCYSFDSGVIEATIRDCTTGFGSYRESNMHLYNPEKESLETFLTTIRELFDEYVNQEALRLTAAISFLWPSRTCDQVVDRYTGDSKKLLDLAKVVQKVNPIMENWYRNLKLKNFVDEVEAKVVALGGSEYDTSGVSRRMAELMPMPSPHVAEKLLELKLREIHPECSAAAYERAKGTFSRGTVEEMELSDIELLPTIKRRKVITSCNAKTLLADPNVGASCKIWTHLVSSLRVGKHDTVHEQSKHLAYDEKAFKTLTSHFKSLNKHCKKESKEFWKLATVPLVTNPLFKILISAGLFPRLTPLTMLPLITIWMESVPLDQDCLRDAIGAFGVAETCEQYTMRCLEYIKTTSQVELQRELDNRPHGNWNPSERPEWLLFEIEMDLLVRSIQKDVAEQMESPPDSKNAVMQLNMGEGKTAVITPLLLLRLADGKQLCRLTVLKSFYNMNRQALQQNLGGILLNRRIYSFPCRRDYRIVGLSIEKLFDVYQECCRKGGICITTPEYRLSFLLKTYEQCRANNHMDAQIFWQIQQWLNQTTRDILDESDEILQVKYQLIYSLGTQMNLDGGSHRWTVLQTLLDIIPSIIGEIEAMSGKGSVEIFRDNVPKGCFPPCRILKSEVYGRFCNLLAKRIVDGGTAIVLPGLKKSQKKILHRFLTEELVQENIFQTVYDFLESDSVAVFQETVLILRGLMTCGVLFASFSKRWRVNYGVNPVGSNPLAVPFRAKDVAAERTEFGHPDVALVLTHLSYYYSGLSDSQVDECLARVMREPDPESEYARFINTLANPHPSIATLPGINMHNYKQKTEHLFPTLRKNKAVIDYWLANVILPVKVKQFPFKMICSPWDLASDRTSKPTTGFSGTNDTRLLLPLMIGQRDLDKLKLTNYEVFSHLCLEENNSYRSLPANVTAKHILKELVVADIPLLLDVGALMLELDKEGVANEWLELADPAKKLAAIYFSADNRLMVKDRSVLDPVPFEISPFRGMLDKCLIYLDDVHTRGTDLKIPSGTKGCVTLGKGVAKDKLVQGCMRMRKLGKGHTVSFWASSEVHNEVVALAKKGKDCGTAEVLKWALNNSRNAIRDGFPHWVAAASSFIRKNAAQESYQASNKTDDDRTQLADTVSQPETTKLLEMYGLPWATTAFPNVAEAKLRKCCDEVNAGEDLRGYQPKVVAHCLNYVSTLTKNCHLLDEEQERELEHELEEEREVFRPQKETPHTPRLHPGILPFLRNRHKTLSSLIVPDWALWLPDGIQRTRVSEHNERHAWGGGIMLTKDFFNTIVVQREQDPLDSFLRPVNWIATFEVNGTRRWLVLSPYEANLLLPEFRSGRVQASLHMYSARLTPNQSTLLELGKLVLPPAGSDHLLTRMAGFHELNTSLSIFAGCTFFGDQMEVDSFTAITGYAPYPRKPEEAQAFEHGRMDNTGFLLPDGRAKLRPKCKFQKNPERLIVGIIRCRYDHFSKFSHISKIVHESSTPEFESQ